MDDTLPVVNAEYTIEKFDGEILLYAESQTQAVYLNDEAHAVWSLCKEGLTVGQIIEYLEQVYPDQKEQIRGDVTTALETLHKNGVIEFADEE
ncbi:PqqD family protein [Desulforhopalus vacuolatus]|uniref:PqqD family protein n=1 Tax=Desulforhopalus vacuolatus TaxID=40414 RepID=UPI0019668BEB|nr:PqqD family protein [Desulforhopalus vacuolatus]MBM9521081.1 PqqD family protein [Desulforhopalus vacuolatus]